MENSKRLENYLRLESYLNDLIYGILYDLGEQYSVEMRLELISFALKKYNDYK